MRRPFALIESDQSGLGIKDAENSNRGVSSHRSR